MFYLTENTTTQHDQYYEMANAPVNRIIPKLAVPTIISMLVTSIYNMADTFFVSQLGTSASGAIGIVFSAMAIIQALSFMVGMGSGNFIARSIGAGKRELAEQVASVAFFTGLIIGLLIAVFGNLSLRNIVYFLGATKTIAPFAEDYARYIFMAAPFMVCSFIMNNLLRFQGKALFSMIGITTGGILNIFLDPIFIFGLGLGTSGAALATALSQIISFCILFFMCNTKKRMHYHSSTKLPSNDKYLPEYYLWWNSFSGTSGNRQCGNYHHEHHGSSLWRRSDRCHVYCQSFYDVHQFGHHRIRPGISASLQLLLWCKDVCPCQRSLLVLYQSQHCNPAGFLCYRFYFLWAYH